LKIKFEDKWKEKIVDNSLNETLMIVASNLTIAFFQRGQTLLTKTNSSMDLNRNSIVIIPQIYDELLKGLKNKLSQLEAKS
jgi:hypothetical protein